MGVYIGYGILAILMIIICIRLFIKKQRLAASAVLLLTVISLLFFWSYADANHYWTVSCNPDDGCMNETGLLVAISFFFMGIALFILILVLLMNLGNLLDRQHRQRSSSKHQESDTLMTQKNMISFIILIVFYMILSYTLLGNPMPIFTGGGLVIIFLILSLSIPVMLLYTDQIRDNNYSKDHIIISVIITHMILVVSLVVYVILYGNYVNAISPDLGYIVVSVSLLINFVCLMKDLRKRWTWIVLGLHILMFILFMLWNSIGIIAIIFAFFYMLVHDVFVVSYGILRYGKMMMDQRHIRKEANL